MKLDDLLTPLEGDLPCGPDLFEAGDSDIEAYAFDVEYKLPESFFNRGGLALDPTTIDFDAECLAASELLARSRDLRILGYLAGFAARSYRFDFFVSTVKIIGDLLEAYPEAINPRAADTIADRRNALGLLASRASVVFPLQFMPLVEDRRLKSISFRRVQVARGKIEAGSVDGTVGDPKPLLDALKSVENLERVKHLKGQFKQLDDDLKRIVSLCAGSPGNAFSVSAEFEPLTNGYAGIVSLLEEVCPDPSTQSDGEVKGESAHSSGGSKVGSMAEASAALDVIEQYFAANEPSSLSFILVRQARALVGKPLVDAIDLLVPQLANNVRIDFEAELGFMINMAQMRLLSTVPAAKSDAVQSSSGPDISSVTAKVGEATVQEFSVDSRESAGVLMRDIESFYATCEPSSPIPVLLSRARETLNSSFTTILSGVLPPRRN